MSSAAVKRIVDDLVALSVACLASTSSCADARKAKSEDVIAVPWQLPQTDGPWESMTYEWTSPAGRPTDRVMWGAIGDGDPVGKFGLEDYDWRNAAVTIGRSMVLYPDGVRHDVQWSHHQIRRNDGLAVCSFAVWGDRAYSADVPSRIIITKTGCFPTEERLQALEERVRRLESLAEPR